MSYTVFSNFKGGLDARRSHLASQPGVLEVLTNAHINQGGEVEKRKAWTRIALPANTFGLESNGDSLVVFGSVGSPGGLPSGVIYQQISNPAGGSALTEVIHSTTFGGQVFVIGSFADTRTYCFYNGSIVKDNYIGSVLSVVPINVQLANQIASAVNFSSYYTAVGPYGGGLNLVDVFSLPGGAFSTTISIVSVAGTLVSQKVSATIPGTPSLVAVGSFRVFAGSEAGGNQVTQVAVGADNLLAGPVAFNDSVEQTAADLATAINAGASIYNATAEAGIVTIFADSSGPTPNGKAVVVTTAGNVCVGNCVFSLSGTDFKLNYIKIDGVDVLGTVFDFPQAPGQTLTAFCAAVVAAINAGTGTHGYLAYSSSNVIFLSKAITSSLDPSLNVEFEIVPDVGGTGAGNEGTTEPLLVSVDKRNVFFSVQTYGTQQLPWIWLSDFVTVNVTGGVPPYRYEWPQFVFGSQGGSISTVSPGSATTAFKAVLLPRFQPTILRGNYSVTCKVTDALGKTGESAPVSMAGPVPGL